MKVKNFNIVKDLLDKRYKVNRGGFFEILGKGFHVTRDNLREDTPYNISYSDRLVIDGEDARVSFIICLEPMINSWQLKDYSRVNKNIRESEEYRKLKSDVFAQFILWCIEDNPELLKGGVEK